MGHQDVLDPSQQLALLDGLAQKVGCTGAQGLEQIVFAGLRRQHDDRCRQGITDRPDRVHHGIAVHVGHVDVEQDQVRTRLLVGVDGLSGVLHAGDVLVAVRPEHQGEELEVGRLIVHEEDSPSFEVVDVIDDGAHQKLSHSWFGLTDAVALAISAVAGVLARTANSTRRVGRHIDPPMAAFSHLFAICVVSMTFHSQESLSTLLTLRLPQILAKGD